MTQSSSPPSLDPLDPSIISTTPHGHSHRQSHLHYSLSPSNPATTTITTPSSLTAADHNKPSHSSSASKRFSKTLKHRSFNLAQFILHPRQQHQHQQQSQETLHHPSSPYYHPSSSLPTNPTPPSFSLASIQGDLPSIDSFNCPCCHHSIYSFNHPELTCPTCGIIWSPPTTQPISPSRLNSPQNHPSPPSPSSPSPSTSSSSAPFLVTPDHLICLNNLSLPDDQLTLFDHDPNLYLASISQLPSKSQLLEDFHQLALTLVSQLFQSAANLSSAFHQSIQSSSSSSQQLSHSLISQFYHAICRGPGGRDILTSHLNQFLLHPPSDLVSILSNKKLSSASSPKSDVSNPPINQQDEFTQWAWAAILLECPILLPSSRIPQQKRRVMTARLLGLISSMPNRFHHRLVSFYSHPSYPTDSFARKAEIINVFISDRINYFLQVPLGFGPVPTTIENIKGHQPNIVQCQLPKYMDDWSLLASSRVLSLLSAANLQSRKLAIETFYNVSIDMIVPTDLIYDFECWETRRSKYTLCGYPFLLSLASKIALLTYEGKQQMGSEARQAFVDNLLGRSLAAPVLSLAIRRSHLVRDSLQQISFSRNQLKKLLKINFIGEEGIDGGGLKKEWFLLLTRQLIAPEYGMFIHDEAQRSIWFNPASTELEEFGLIGVVLGLAIYNRATLDFGLPLVGYRKLLGVKVNGLKDLSNIKPEVAKSLRWMLDYDGDDFEDVVCRTFVGEYDAYGTVVEVPLIPNGSNVPVTKSNRTEFVRLYCDFILNRSIEQQFKAFSDGFNSIMAGNGLSLFQAEEIERLVSGYNQAEKLDIKELQRITEYEGFRDPSKDSTIQLFWEVVDRFSFEDQRNLLRFITGTDRIPAVGLSGLKLKISRAHSTSSSSCSKDGCRADQRLPESHTCFNQLILPPFTSFESLDHKLRLAITESEGFGLN